MKFGMTCDNVGHVGIVPMAENLGYDFCWAFDTQLMRSNPWAVLALAAQQTRTIQLGTGVAVPSLRLAPVAANSIATINRLAPGRTFFGVGTGNTAMRTLGQAPTRIGDMAEYIRVMRGLLAGGEVDFTYEGSTHPIRFQNLDQDYIDIENYIPIQVSGFGPRAQKLAGELGDGVITGIPRGGAIAQVLANARAGAKAAGRTLGDDFECHALVNLLLLQPGQTLESDAVIAQCGPSIMANVHFLVDWVKETGREPPDYVLPIWEEYLAFHEKRAAETAHQKLHEAHYSHIDAEEARFITPEMIKTFCIAGQPEEMIEQLTELEKQGLTGINFVAPFEQQYSLIEDFARRVVHKMK
ncbi:MAG: LLM class flavin-dependent oxidoreductase [Alphaproteobacteria bacterium]